MKHVYIQPRTAPNGRCAYDLLNINGGFVGGSPADYATIGEAYQLGFQQVEAFPDSFTLISPAMVADLLSSTVHHLHTLKTYSDASLITPPNHGLDELILKIEKLLKG